MRRIAPAASGAAGGLQTLVPICMKGLIEPGHLTWPQLIEKLTVNPARVLGIERGTLKPGADADVTIIDPQAEWTIDAYQFHSKSRNTPFSGWNLTGRAVGTVLGRRVRFQMEDRIFLL